VIWRPGALDHGTRILEVAAGAVDDHRKAAALQGGQPLSRAAIAQQVLHPIRHGPGAAGEQGELVARAQQPLHQRPAHEAGAAHHQDVHGCLRDCAPFKPCGGSDPSAERSPGARAREAHHCLERIPALSASLP